MTWTFVFLCDVFFVDSTPWDENHHEKTPFGVKFIFFFKGECLIFVVNYIGNHK